MIENMSANTKLIAILRDRISNHDFAALSFEGGFQAPNNFSIGRIEEDLKLGRFPVADYYEYAWAIYECSRENIKTMSPAIRILLAAFFVYCQKRSNWGLPIDSEYHQLGLEAIFECNCLELSLAYLSFLDWLNTAVAATDGYDSYFCLLAMTYLRAHLSRTVDVEFKVALVELANRATGTSEHELTVAENGLDWWRNISSGLVGGEVNLQQLIEILPARK